MMMMQSLWFVLFSTSSSLSYPLPSASVSVYQRTKSFAFDLLSLFFFSIFYHLFFSASQLELRQWKWTSKLYPLSRMIVSVFFSQTNLIMISLMTNKTVWKQTNGTRWFESGVKEKKSKMVFKINKQTHTSIIGGWVYAVWWYSEKKRDGEIFHPNQFEDFDTFGQFRSDSLKRSVNHLIMHRFCSVSFFCSVFQMCIDTIIKKRETER